MNETLLVSVPKRLLEESAAVSEDLGISVPEVVRRRLEELVRRRALPFEPPVESALAEYGAAPEQAERAAARALAELDVDRAAGRLMRFTGVFPRDAD